MSDTQPTEPLPSEPGRTPPGPYAGAPDGAGPHGTAQYGAAPGGSAPGGSASYGAAPGGPGPYGPGGYRPVPGEPFYKRHGLAFAISTLVLSIVVVLGIVTAGAFAVASVVAHVGERTISHILPPGHGGAPMPGQPGKGNGNGGGGGGGGGQNGGGTQQGRVLLRGTIASISGDTWTIDRQNGGSVEVTVSSSTIFGTPGQSASKSDFAQGDEVIVIGKGADGSVTASRILKLAAFPTRPPSTPGSPATPGS
ncbi:MULTISPECIES: DUF5666 domain-containing protein [unclassified Leifsonia]|uniref:DUF5666 domain-containing protein n=1 Tax=unclassified Leifsonia TaxID=2663824 RepID=UPI0008A7A21A|nr:MULTISPECIES: DUF5666 domain-containing protein [unclassified Leifsonia]SEH76102.1 hypothetical protein SAMN04515694_103240 [Leifsonia sp. CL154]SFL37701.1 hypothetical protein SAMN04515692_103241 [Leifsonia sp. CL147]